MREHMTAEPATELSLTRAKRPQKKPAAPEGEEGTMICKICGEKKFKHEVYPDGVCTKCKLPEKIRGIVK